MKKIIVIFLVLGAFCLGFVAPTVIPLGMRIETQPTWLKFVPKTYLKGYDGDNKKVGTLLVTVRSFDVFQIGGKDTIDMSPDAGQMYVKYTDARGTEKRRYLGYYRSRQEYDAVNHIAYGDLSDDGINPMFDEERSNLKLANTMFFNKSNTSCHYFQLDRWSVPYKMDLVDAINPYITSQ